MKDLHLERKMDPQVAILYATVADTFNRLQRLVEGTEENELSYKGSENNENSIGQLLQHLAVVDLHWLYRFKGEDVPPTFENKYGPMLNEVGELPSLRKKHIARVNARL